MLSIFWVRVAIAIGEAFYHETVHRAITGRRLHFLEVQIESHIFLTVVTSLESTSVAGP